MKKIKTAKVTGELWEAFHVHIDFKTLFFCTFKLSGSIESLFINLLFDSFADSISDVAFGAILEFYNILF